VSRPLSSFTVAELDALPIGYRFVDPSDGDVLTKEADGWRRSLGLKGEIAHDSWTIRTALGTDFQTIDDVTPEPPPVALEPFAGRLHVAIPTDAPVLSWSPPGDPGVFPSEPKTITLDEWRELCRKTDYTEPVTRPDYPGVTFAVTDVNPRAPDWTPPKRRVYSTVDGCTKVADIPPDLVGPVNLSALDWRDTDPVTGLLDFPAVAPQGGHTAREANVIAASIGWPTVPMADLSNETNGVVVRFDGDPYHRTNCPTCKAPIFMLAGTGIPTTGGLDARSGVIARDTDWSPHTCATCPPVPPYVPLPPITIDTTDPTCVRRVTGAPMGLPPRTLASGEANRYTREMAEARAARYRMDGYTDVTVSVYRPDPKAPAEKCPACGEHGWHDSRCDLDSYHLRTYLRTNADPTSTADQVAAALDLLTEEDRALVTAPVPWSRPC